MDLQNDYLEKLKARKPESNARTFVAEEIEKILPELEWDTEKLASQKSALMVWANRLYRQKTHAEFMDTLSFLRGRGLHVMQAVKMMVNKCRK